MEISLQCYRRTHDGIQPTKKWRIRRDKRNKQLAFIGTWVQTLDKFDFTLRLDAIPECSDWVGDNTKCTLQRGSNLAQATYDDAVADCHGRGGRLPKLTSAEEIGAQFEFNGQVVGLGDNWISLTSNADRYHP